MENKKTIILQRVKMYMIVLYILFTGVAIFKLTHYSYDVFNDKQRFGVNDMVLDCSPYYQRFDAHNVMGLRLYLKNEENFQDGFIYVNIGNYKTGEVLFKSKISASDVHDNYDDYIDVVSDKVLENESGLFWYNIYTDPELENKIKIQYFGHESNKNYLMHVGKHLYGYREKTFVYSLLQRRIPFTFIMWIFVTCIVILNLLFAGSKKNMHSSGECGNTVQIRYGISRRILFILLLVLGLFGTGIIKKSTFYADTISVEIEDERFEEGLTLEEKSVTNFKFVGINQELNNIRFKLESYSDDLAEFTLVLNDENDECIASIESSDLEFDGTWLNWKLADLKLDNAMTYSMDIFFPIIGDKTSPVIKKIVCDYGSENTISQRKIIVGICGLILVSVLVIVYGKNIEKSLHMEEQHEKMFY